MSFTLHGVGVSGGIAIGHAHLVSHARLEVAHYVVPPRQAPEESARFDAAIRTVRTELEELRANVPATAPAEFIAFINLHLMILDDSTLSVAPRKIIETEQCNAEWALKVQMEALLAQFDAIEDGYLRERKTDVVQVVERVMKALSGQPGHIPAPAADAEQDLILVAHDLSPADVVQFKQHRFGSFITDLGGTTSHTAVVARSLNIPSIVALHHARQLIRESELLIVDGTQGVVIVDPDRQVFAEYQLRQHQFERERQKLKRLKDTRATTLDGVAVELHANIELPADVIVARENGATGIGLFRSEFLFLNRNDLPDEDEQFEAYRQAAQAMEGLPVTIRTYDLGADKHTEDAQRITTNPALGLRAIRLCLTEPQRFLIQLRAMLRASQFGKINIMIPMLMNAAEVDQALQLLARAKQSLDDEDVAYDRGIRVGGMIEVPAAALALGLFTRKLDFLSVGTNDLIQYTLAIDRTDDTVAHLYDPLHPAVLNLLAHIFRTANKAHVPVAVCGEMAGDASLTRLLLALGLRQYSMHSAHLLDVKQQILRSNVSEIKPLAQKMLRASDPEKLRALLDRLNA
ncbi:MAG: phosphoenolpyruvate--protein phosphotransferase [Betaproteobacteria bacterium RIFCSPLOWO2_12_FULL_62_58]|nr:MAG: phosphoenolpyruvate--protein phosphotransferase [Betaproteobacteria bacterium RIFCSPLOWO2_12_FULL_62_58]